MQTVADYLRALDEDGPGLEKSLTAADGYSGVLVQLVQNDKTVVDVTPWAGLDVDRARDVTVLPVYRLEKKAIAVGRSRSADLTINLERLSKIHAQLKLRSNGDLEIDDAASKNGTFVGPSRLVRGAPTRLTDGGSFHLGPYPFRWFTPKAFIAWLMRMKTDEEPTVTGTAVARLEIIGPLGKGGMADVALARRFGPGGFAKEIALKRLLPEMAHDKNFVDMFLQEARLAARINHQTVVSIFDLGWDGQRYFIAMEYVAGWNLAALQRAARRSGKDMPVPVACRIAADLCAGLKAAHTSTDETGTPLRIIHRDVSPQNVLVSTEGIAKLSDFGVSRAADSIRHTKTGELKGKLAYMAPEQLQDSFGPVDHRTDIFSAAVTIYECFIGVPLFRKANDVDTMHALLHDPIKYLRDVRKDVPARLADALAHGLEREVARRTPEIAQLNDEMTLVCSELSADQNAVHQWLDTLVAADALPHVGLKQADSPGAKTEIVRR